MGVSKESLSSTIIDKIRLLESQNASLQLALEESRAALNLQTARLAESDTKLKVMLKEQSEMFELFLADVEMGEESGGESTGVEDIEEGMWEVCTELMV
ncbi:hypothetical protein HDU67_001389 [Dinochytrium kinnereticum]|nr:hypothetical protein HDU67_001389 [Dinochytrium kinnereticum]